MTPAPIDRRSSMTTATATTVTIYSVTCTKAYQMAEQGTGFSLRPWGGDTAHYEGTDDGGREYLLPEGHELAECNGGTVEIYDADGRHCPLGSSYGRPALVTGDRLVVLRPAGDAERDCRNNVIA
jgi:hypothetical protein